MQHRRQAGDTIVEVLIAMAIIGSVLGGAYATATRSLRIGIQAQERSEALKLVEGQLERLKYRSQVTPSTFNNEFRQASETYCLDQLTQKFNATNAACQDISGKYDVSIRYTPSPDRIFTATVSWQRIGSSDNDNVSIRYRL